METGATPVLRNGYGLGFKLPYMDLCMFFIKYMLTICVHMLLILCDYMLFDILAERFFESQPRARLGSVTRLRCASARQVRYA